MRDLLSGEIVAWHDYWSPPARYRPLVSLVAQVIPSISVDLFKAFCRSKSEVAGKFTMFIMFIATVSMKYIFFLHSSNILVAEWLRRPFHLQDRPLLPFETYGDVVDSSVTWTWNLVDITGTPWMAHVTGMLWDVTGCCGHLICDKACCICELDSKLNMENQ
jgi:hypothetical protein